MNGFSPQKWFIFLLFHLIGSRPSTPALEGSLWVQCAFALASLPEADKKRPRKGSTA